MTVSPELIFDRAGVRAVDQAAIDEYGIPGIVLMENAAQGLAAQALKMIAGHDRNEWILIICGSGNNGGDGYALARHLHNHGVAVALVPLAEPTPNSDARINRAICRRMNLREIDVDAVPAFALSNSIALLVDAIFGTGLDRPITGRPAEIIQWMNASGIPILAADLPSGLDCDTGEVLGTAVRAACTVTFVGRKRGFDSPAAQNLLGEVIVADIGAPRELVERLGKRSN